MLFFQEIKVQKLTNINSIMYARLQRHLWTFWEKIILVTFVATPLFDAIFEFSIKFYI